MRNFYPVDNKSKIVLLLTLVVLIAVFGPWAWKGESGNLSFFFWATMLTPLALSIISFIGLLLDKEVKK